MMDATLEALPTRAVFRVMLIGHSFIRRLQTYSERSGHASDPYANLRLDRNQFRLSFIGLPGASVNGARSLQPQLHTIQTIHPDIVFLEIGSNDLCDPNLEPRILAQNVISLARFIHIGYNVQCVVIGSILPRVGSTWRSYNTRVIVTNEYLREFSIPEVGLYFWRHRGFTDCSVNPFSGDGVHLNPQGMQKYVRSIRWAVLSYKSKLMRSV